MGVAARLLAPLPPPRGVELRERLPVGVARSSSSSSSGESRRVRSSQEAWGAAADSEVAAGVARPVGSRSVRSPSYSASSAVRSPTCREGIIYSQCDVQITVELITQIRIRIRKKKKVIHIA